MRAARSRGPSRGQVKHPRNKSARASNSRVRDALESSGASEFRQSRSDGGRGNPDVEISHTERLLELSWVCVFGAYLAESMNPAY